MKQHFEPILKPLRGEYNSIRYRFWGLPKEYVSYYLGYRLFGRSWIDFYSDRLDEAARQSTDKAPSAAYLDHGKAHMEYMRSHGLKPEHQFLDYGCGVLRTGVHLIGYLDDKKYVGVDISAERLNKGRKLVQSHGLSDDSYTLHAVGDCELKELNGYKFDFVWAKSVLTHMPVEDIKVMLRSIKDLLSDNGVFFFTFGGQVDRATRVNIKDFYYPVEEMRGLCEAAGFRFELQEDWDPVKQGDHMARISLK